MREYTHTKTSRLAAAVAAGAFAAGLGATAPATAEVESKDAIILTLHDWTGQYITTQIMGSHRITPR